MNSPVILAKGNNFLVLNRSAALKSSPPFYALTFILAHPDPAAPVAAMQIEHAYHFPHHLEPEITLTFHQDRDRNFRIVHRYKGKTPSFRDYKTDTHQRDAYTDAHRICVTLEELLKQGYITEPMYNAARAIENTLGKNPDIVQKAPAAQRILLKPVIDGLNPHGRRERRALSA